MNWFQGQIESILVLQTWAFRKAVKNPPFGGKGGPEVIMALKNCVACAPVRDMRDLCGMRAHVGSGRRMPRKVAPKI